ncbi:phenylalanine--tRNA ligase subunit beta [Candidatus Dojkabacteria bacterium]|nr:phenylalanine--tRNA ligase subunit beta [Candidatus Dojkabacteria bacterium]
MKVSLNTIRKLTEIKIKPDKLEDKIDQTLGEVEGVEDLSEKYKNITIAEIVEKSPHPDADKLGVYKLNIGKKSPVQVVAGDLTLDVGDRVAYFPIGTRVPYNPSPEKYDGTVKKTKLRGVESNGMMASARELDISGNHESVMRLNDEIGKQARPGDNFADAYGLNDLVFDIENKAMTNRPECFGIIGLAREIAGIQGIKFETPAWFDYGYGGKDFSREVVPENESKVDLDVKNQVPKLVNRYMAVVVEDLKIKDSPVWLQLELMKAGVRPINNVVDITNYLMIMTGQPIHAFDRDKLVKRDSGADKKNVKIAVRQSNKDERIVVIDGKTHELDDEIVVITDSSSPIGVAGVMGGLDTEIDERSQSAVIEVANFDMYSIRKTSMKLGIFSDAVTRFSKNQDPEMCEPVMYKALEMLNELAGGKVVSELVDIYPNPREVRKLKISIKGIQESIGFDLPGKDIARLLENVELGTEVKGDELIITIPTYRQDLNIDEDIYEEVARLYGFSKIPLKLPTRKFKPISRNPILELQEKVRDFLTAAGAYEMITYNFISKELMKKCNLSPSKAYHIKNALSPELAYMRPNLMPSIIEKAVMNLKKGYAEFALYEINKSHIKGQMDEENLPKEFRTVGFVYATADKVANSKYEGSPYYMAKKYLDELLSYLKTMDVGYERPSGKKVSDYPVWIQNAMTLYSKGSWAIISYTFHNKKYYLGMVGDFCPHLKKSMEMPKYSAGFELDIEALLKISGLGGYYQEPSIYPKVTQDLCFVVDRDVPYQALVDTIKNEVDDRDVYVSVDPVDIYSGQGAVEETGDGQSAKQVTIRLVLQHQERVLDEKEISDWRKRVIRAVKQGCGGKLK